jgi:integrase
MRQAELFGLQWADVKWTSGTVYVRRQVQRTPHYGWCFVEPKTRAGRRSLKLGEETLHRLRVHKQRQEQMKLLAGTYWQDLDLIFPTSVGTPGDPSNLRKDFIKILTAASLPKLRFHDLRHTAASLMLNHGIPVIVVSHG